MRAGRSRVFRTIFGLAALLSNTCLPAFAQSSRVDGGVVSRSTFGFYWETHLEPAVPELSDDFYTIATDSSGIIHRIMRDSSRRMYFGYDVRVDVLPEPNTYRVTFSQLTMTPELTRQFLGAPFDWSSLQKPTFPAPQTVRGGEILELILLTNNATGQKIVDYVTVQEPARQPPTFRNFTIPDREFAVAIGAPRDFAAGDAELQIREPRLSINRKLLESTIGLNMDAAGAVLWFFVPNRGRYILSLAPHPDLGFRKAGEVRGTSLSFTLGNDTFSLASGGRIAPGRAPFNLYVLHDPRWKPSYANADLSAFMMGSADRAELLVRSSPRSWSGYCLS